MKLDWALKRFDDLMPREVYDLLRLRSEVFVVEQDCPYLDPDGKDTHPDAHHLLGRDETGSLAAYLRLLPAGVSYDEPSFGRVVTSPRHRKLGLGDEMVQVALRHMATLWPGIPVRIGAQAHLTEYYGRHGFVVDSEEYLEDAIPHRQMLRRG